MEGRGRRGPIPCRCWGSGGWVCTVHRQHRLCETEGGRPSRECSITSQRACHPIPSLSLTTERPLSTGWVGTGWVRTRKDQAGEGAPSPVNTRSELRTGSGWSCCGWRTWLWWWRWWWPPCPARGAHGSQSGQNTAGPHTLLAGHPAPTSCWHSRGPACPPPAAALSFVSPAPPSGWHV